MDCHCQKSGCKDIELSSTSISQLWLFKNLVPSEITVLIREAQQKIIVKGDPLFIQSEPADELYLINRGRIKLVKILDDGSEPVLDIRKAGDFVGEDIFSNQKKYPVSAICLEDTLISAFSRSRFEQLVLQNPNIGFQVLKNLSERISWLTSRVGTLTVANTVERLYYVLCNIAKEHGSANPRGIKIQFSLTHEDLGFLTGSHRVSITRAMKALKQAGKIIYEGRRVILPELKTV